MKRRCCSGSGFLSRACKTWTRADRSPAVFWASESLCTALPLT
jgi:hypothetical protein